MSGQLEGEVYACALGNIYTFGPTFRAENSDTSRHLAEFWMIEPEMAFCDIRCNMELAEEFLKEILRTVLDSVPRTWSSSTCGSSRGFWKVSARWSESEFVRITYTDAVRELESSGRTFEYPVSWGSDLQSEHEKYLTEEVTRAR